MKDRCKLFCRVAGNTAYYQLRDRVIDGTPCGPDTNDICVQGLCRVITVLLLTLRSSLGQAGASAPCSRQFLACPRHSEDASSVCRLCKPQVV